MMGRQETALKLLKELKATTKKEKLSESIAKNIAAIHKNLKNNQSNSKNYFRKHAKLAARRNGLEASFISNLSEVKKNSDVKSLILKKARTVLPENPKASLDLVDAILDYFQGDLAALLLRGEALASLKKPSDAMEIWIDLARSDNEKIAEKASELVSQHFSRRAITISKKISPEEAISFFIKEHFKLNLVPRLNKGINQILQRLDAFDGTLQDPELEQLQLQLLLNTQLIECLEDQLREQGRLGGTPTAQIPGAIRKTGSKVG
jgi:hypothetical protein